MYSKRHLSKTAKEMREKKRSLKKRKKSRLQHNLCLKTEDRVGSVFWLGTVSSNPVLITKFVVFRETCLCTYPTQLCSCTFLVGEEETNCSTRTSTGEFLVQLHSVRSILSRLRSGLIGRVAFTLCFIFSCFCVKFFFSSRHCLIDFLLVNWFRLCQSRFLVLSKGFVFKTCLPDSADNESDERVSAGSWATLSH